jgi:hypothetical protein
MQSAHADRMTHARVIPSLDEQLRGTDEKSGRAKILEYRLAKQFEPRVKDGARIAENFGLRRAVFRAIP